MLKNQSEQNELGCLRVPSIDLHELKIVPAASDLKRMESRNRTKHVRLGIGKGSNVLNHISHEDVVDYDYPSGGGRDLAEEYSRG
ncbi:hypothetical protein Vadar_032588 [Vaccinium darrowii]|uniref:Uncharacterized protein n=1 Tax=Vaccinium darrowii TaxID=229202 RepID=A0ACB7XWA9_9ERIC|nr:hypothetical protein Vadar_032588 [Vaccinium darrowii]